MSWLTCRPFFGRKQEKLIPPSFEEVDFTIEYYPLTGRYYPKYGEYYLEKNCSTGIIEKNKPMFFQYSDYGKSEEQALIIIELFKEHYFKKNVKTIKVK